MSLRFLSVVVLLALTSLCYAKGYYKKIQATGGQNTERVIRPKLKTQFDKNKMEVAEKMKKVKNMEDFLKVFKVPYVKKRILSAAKPNRPFDLGANSDKSKAPQYDIYISKQTSLVGDSMPMTLGSSSSSTTTTVKLNSEDLTCTPRPTVYNLPASYSYFTYPSCFTLNQCGGCCNTKPDYICRPTEISIAEETYIKMSYLTNQMTTETVQLNHHKSCACSCKIEASDCLSTQTFDPNVCTCVCNGPQPCLLNQVWSDNECRCVCKTSPEPCDFKKEWSQEKCSCQCKEATCAIGEIQDPATCFCVKI